MADIDTAALKENFATVAAHGGDEVALYFYSYLFLKYPETRDWGRVKSQGDPDV